jgi:hypothetical protein
MTRRAPGERIFCAANLGDAGLRLDACLLAGAGPEQEPWRKLLDAADPAYAGTGPAMPDTLDPATGLLELPAYGLVLYHTKEPL